MEAQQQQKALSSQEQELAQAPLCWLHFYASILRLDEDPKLTFLVITSFKRASSIVSKRGLKHELNVSSCAKYRVNAVKCSQAIGKNSFTLLP